MEITFRQTCTEDQNKQVEFLDADHGIDPAAPLGFHTTNFIKPTAVNRVFYMANPITHLTFSSPLFLGRLFVSEDLMN